MYRKVNAKTTSRNVEFYHFDCFAIIVKEKARDALPPPLESVDVSNL